MLIHTLPIVTHYIESLNQSLKATPGTWTLSRCQQAWLHTVLMGILVTGTLNWAAFERRSLKAYKQSSLRWMFYHAKIMWPRLMQCSIRCVLAHYGLTCGVLAIDDTDKRRAKKTRCIAYAHKVKDKGTGGYFRGQQLVFMVLVTDVVTLPVGFRWYRPDPAMTAWHRQNKQLKKAGVPAKQRPAKPAPNPDYPTKQALALDMVRAFTQWFPEFKVQAILADALYGTGDFMDQASALTGQAQVVSQLRGNQVIRSRGKPVKLSAYFARQAGVETMLTIRGGKKKPVTLLAARLRVKAHGKKRFVIALKYEGESDYRYLVASDLSWRHQDIAALYTLRWLVEVFIQDWKAHAGWDRLTKHQGEEGSTRGVILSLLFDHMLLLHPAQSARLKNKQPGLSVGCLIESLRVDALLGQMEGIVQSPEPATAFAAFTAVIKETLVQRQSSKHMAGLNLGRLDSTPSLKCQAQE